MYPTKRIPVVFALLLVCMGSIHAQSPIFSWASPRSMALGGVRATGFDEPANMHLNPASLVEIERFTVSSGIAANMMRGTVDPPGLKAFDTANDPVPAPHITGGINFGARLVSAGISLNTFDAYRVRFPDDSPARYQGSDLALYSGGVDVAIGFMPIQDWAFGVKVGLMGSHASWKRRLNPFPSEPLPEFDMNWKLKMHSLSDINVLGGVLWSPTYRFKTGLTWRPRMRYDLKGRLAVDIPDIMGGTRISSDIQRLKITIPQEIRLGFHWIATERMDIYCDVVWTEASSLETRKISAEDPKSPYIHSELIVPIRLKDVWHAHMGMEYLASAFVTLRVGGFAYTDSVQPGYEMAFLPREARYGVTAGAGLNFFQWLVDISAGQAVYDTGHISGSKLPFSFKAETRYTQYFAAISLTYSF